ncbi:MAG: biotin/lipoyl-binding protein [Proteobacteria bacterium]|nr:biotin/lipoyl-binding protein [Pseudomonadota bacterium]
MARITAHHRDRRRGGREVHAGQLLVRLDCREQQAALQAAQAQLAAADGQAAAAQGWSRGRWRSLKLPGPRPVQAVRSRGRSAPAAPRHAPGSARIRGAPGARAGRRRWSSIASARASPGSTRQLGALRAQQQAARGQATAAAAPGAGSARKPKAALAAVGAARANVQRAQTLVESASCGPRSTGWCRRVPSSPASWRCPAAAS